MSSVAEMFFLFSAGDPSVVLEALRLGQTLIVNKDYRIGEDIVALTNKSNLDVDLFRRFYVLPDATFISELEMDEGNKRETGKYRYLMDRVGAASIDLILYKKPMDGEVCVGSLAFQKKTYRTKYGSLEPRPAAFSDSFFVISSYIKQSTQPITNQKTPKTVHAFPRALSLLRQDPFCSPWSSLDLTDLNEN